MMQKAAAPRFEDTRLYTSTQKPRLVYFQNRYDRTLPEFLLNHKLEHVRCLSFFFDVVVIHEDCDYRQICDMHQPDIALFESGVNLLTCRKPRITNVKSSNAIPKLALLNADAWCETRTGSLADIEQWGVDAVFSIAATAGEHLPELAGRLFVWPNSVDPEVYKDYHQEKLIPVLLSGASAALYPWRRRVYKLIAQHYPTLSCPHRGYLSRTSPGQVFVGEAYARLLNAASVSPACGTVAGEVVRKHFEIPACNTCLITEETPHIKQAGFADMTNCVFADSHDLLDKLELLFTNQEQLQRITAEGHKLVQSRHTMRQRDQILQWYLLNKDLPAHHRIIQPDPFRPLYIAPATQQESLVPAISWGKHLQAMREGDLLLSTGDIEAARARYRLCLSYMHRLPEARFKLALCDLYTGKASAANAQIFELIQYCLDEYGAPVPDPVEWAYYILSLMCTGELRGASKYAEEFPMLRHPELDRVRFVFRALNRAGVRDKRDDHAARNPSIHQCPEQSDSEWLQTLYKNLRACGQEALAEKIIVAVGRMKPDTEAPTTSAPITHSKRHAARSGPLSRTFLRYRVERKMAQLRKSLKGQRLLPLKRRRKEARLSAGHATLLASMREITRDISAKTVLLWGETLVEPALAAVREGSIGTSPAPLICCVEDPTPDATEQVIREFKQSNSIESFDLILVAWRDEKTASQVTGQMMTELRSAGCLVFADAEGPHCKRIVQELLATSEYMLSDRDVIDESYIILMKKAAPLPVGIAEPVRETIL